MAKKKKKKHPKKRATKRAKPRKRPKARAKKSRKCGACGHASRHGKTGCHHVSSGGLFCSCKHTSPA